MKLTDAEKAMLHGENGLARQKALELLVRYGEALGAERLVATNNVCGSMVTAFPHMDALLQRFADNNALSRELFCNTDATFDFPPVTAFSCQIQQAFDPDRWQEMGVSKEMAEITLLCDESEARMGINLTCTCTPYLAGNLPVFKEHCAWQESSAVSYINSVLGARTNCEGRESTVCAMLTGKIPYWGYHTDAHRAATQVIDVVYNVTSVQDWGLLGYYAGQVVGEKVPVFTRVRGIPELEMFKYCGAAGASSGGIEMYHVVGLTPEAHTLEQALGGKKAQASFSFGPAERRATYERLNSVGSRTAVDFVALGCPHYSIKEVWQLAKLLDGKTVNANVAFWVFVAKAVKTVADRNGYTAILEKAGAKLLGDCCPSMGKIIPKGVTVMACDSPKQVHYLPAVCGIEAWYGTMEECVNAAVSGKWEGEYK